jgi:hypothetical protein
MIDAVRWALIQLNFQESGFPKTPLVAACLSHPVEESAAVSTAGRPTAIREWQSKTRSPASRNWWQFAICDPPRGGRVLTETRCGERSHRGGSDAHGSS